MAILNDLLVNGISRLIGPVYGASFIRHGGTSLQLLKANGSTLDFDTSVTTKFLRNDGQWAVPAGGGGGGGSTVTVNNANITLSTTASTYITVDGTSCSMKLPASVPTTWLGTASTACASGNHTHTASQITNLSSNVVTSITTATGSYSALSNSTGAVTVTIPSTTSHLTNAASFSKSAFSGTLTLATTAANLLYVNTATMKIQLPTTDPYTSARTPSSHTHGNITNGGTITTNVAVASGDRLVITDSSATSSINATSIAFDGTTTTQFLSKKGTWETASGGGGTKCTAFGTCSTAAATTTKDVTISGYTVHDDDIVTIYFTNSVPANATLKINNGTSLPMITGLMTPVTAGMINAGDTATFILEPSQLVAAVLLSVDRSIKAVTIYTGTTTPSSSTGINGDIYIQTN